VLIVVVTAVAIAVVISGGWEWRLPGRTVSVRSVGNLLLAAAVLWLLRLLTPRVTFLWRWRGRRRRRDAADEPEPDSLGALSLKLLRRFTVILDTVSERDALRIIVALIVLATIIRILNVIFHFGFITGDDVEVQEMTLSALFGRRWSVWDLRSAFFPLTFLYPIQWALASAGVRDTFTLVAAARLVVTGFAALNIWLVYRIGAKLYGARAEGLLAAGLFAANHLHMAFGGAELPRVVASTFALLAFAALLAPAAAMALAGGLLLGVAACLRFGEAVFIVPALPLRARQRLTHAALAAVAWLVAMLVILGVADAWYWGDAFHSARAAVDYTLVQRASTRGIESTAYYLTHVPAWSDYLLCGLALCSARTAGAAPLIWALIPIVLLSALPHKEPRYVIVTIPFLALAASGSLRSWIKRLASDEFAARPERAAMGALLLTLAIGGSLLFNASKYRFVRSEETVRLAWQLRAAGASGLAAEQLWRFGGRLYLAETMPTLIDLDPGLADGDPHFAAAACRDGVNWVALRATQIGSWKLATLRGCGFAERLLLPSGSTGYATFTRSQPRR
jgi:hypothetical protein